MSIGIRKFKKTKVGSIPEDWQAVKIKNVAETSSGGTPSRNNKEYFKGSTPWVKTGELTNKYLEKTKECISKLAIKNSSAKVFPKDTILMAMYGATIGKMSILNVDASCNQACCSIIPDKSKASTEYIYYALEYRKPLLISMGSGGAQPNISQQIIKVFEIPLPEIVEQEKIAEILTTVDADIEKTNAIIKEAQQLKTGLMEKLFTEGIGHTRFKKTKIGKVPEAWDVVKLGEICVQKSEKFEPRLSDEVMPYIGLEHIEAGLHKITGYGYSNETLSTKYLFKKDDILYGKLRPYLNKVWLSEFDGACTTEILALKANNLILQDILYYLLQQKRFVEFANSHTEGTNLPRVNWKDLVKYNIALPSISEQKKIFEIISEVDAKLENEQNYKSELEQFKKGLLQVLLTGKIRVKI